MTKAYKFFRLESQEVSIEKGNYPIEKILPRGPIFESENNAIDWLEENGELGVKYILLPLYSL